MNSLDDAILHDMLEFIKESAIVFDKSLVIIDANYQTNLLFGLSENPVGHSVNDFLTDDSKLCELIRLFVQDNKSQLQKELVGVHYFATIKKSSLANSTDNYYILVINKKVPTSPFSYYFENFEFINNLANAVQEVFYLQDIVKDEFLLLTDNSVEHFGYSLEELNRIKFNKIIKKIERIAIDDGAPEPLDLASKSKRPMRNEYLLQMKEGGHKWFEEKAIKIRDSKGKNIGQLGILKNLTNEKSLLLTLKETQHNLINLLNYSPIGIAVIQSGKIVFVNNEGVKIIGAQTANDILGLSTLRFTTREYLSTQANIYSKIRHHDQNIEEFDQVVYNCKREKISIAGSAIPIQYEGKFAVQIIFRDVTLIERQEKIHKTVLQILEASDSISDLKTFYSFIHTSISSLLPAKNFYIALVDKTSHQLTFPYLVDEYDDDSSISLDSRGLTMHVMRGNTSLLVDFEGIIKLRDEGEVVLIGETAQKWLGVPLKIQNETIGAIVIQDYKDKNAYTPDDMRLLEPIAFSISRAIERKSDEKTRLDLIRQLREVNDAKDKLFSIVSHDMRTPFSSILGFVNILISEYDDLSKEEALGILDSLNRVSKGAFEMLTNLLEFSRFQRGIMDFTPADIDLNELINDIVGFVQGASNKKQLSILVDLPSEFHIFADKKMVSSVIQNLFSNAIKFSKPSHEIKLTGVLKENFVEISIADQGVGMSPNDVAKLFNLDTIQSTYGTENEVGAGLGLLLVHDFVHKNGGTISVTSTKGVGTTFTFFLPIAKP